MGEKETYVCKKMWTGLQAASEYHDRRRLAQVLPIWSVTHWRLCERTQVVEAGEEMITTPKDAAEFRKACSVFRKHITPNSQTRREFEEIVQVIVLDALERMKVE